jgi:hypothetical protein
VVVTTHASTHEEGPVRLFALFGGGGR